MGIGELSTANGNKHSGSSLRVSHVVVKYFNPHTNQYTHALEDVSFEVAPGEFVAIVGPSGCGKTTLLKAIHGLVPIESGGVYVGNRKVTKPGPERAMVFQSPSLMPWRTVLGNVVYGLELQRRPKKESLERAAEWIRIVGLEGFDHYYPHELSGGMQQRVNIARAIVSDPETLLLDEPFANLDAQTREFMQAELLRIWSIARKTVVFITHQIDEACYLADRVIVLTARPGQIKAIVETNLGRPRKLSMKRTPEFLTLIDKCWELISEEVKAAGLVSSDVEL